MSRRTHDELDAAFAKHEAEHEAFELRTVNRAREEMNDVADGVKEHVSAAVQPIAAQLDENARFRSRKEAREELDLQARQKLADRKTKAEIALKKAQRRAVWIRIAIAVAAFAAGVLLKECHL
jgi:hypothetical protein